MEKKNILFGLRPIIEAIEAGHEFEKIYLKKGADGVLLNELAALCKARHIRVQWVPVEKLNHLTRSNHQGAVGVTSAIDYVDVYDMLDNIPEDETPLIVVFDGVTDVRNFGAIARSAECAGAHGLILPIKNSAPVNADSMKTSAGALSIIPVSRVGSLRNTIRILQNAGLQIVAASEKSALPLYRADLTRPTALVLGSEDSGHRKEQHAAVRGRPDQADRAGNGQRGRGHFERGAQDVRCTVGHSTQRYDRIAQCQCGSGCDVV